MAQALPGMIHTDWDILRNSMLFLAIYMSLISGFPEWLPEQQRVLNQWKRLLETHFEQFCFTPMDTPVVERMSTLLSKGDDSEIYTLGRWADLAQDHRVNPSENDVKNPASDLHKKPLTPERQLGLRFDLTIPLARYVVQHRGVLVFPYRRYHIAPVWRGERPQEGRFRQFYQCDIDVVGQDTLPSAYDGDMIFIMHRALESLDIQSFLGPVCWHINHRHVLTSWADYAGISDVTGALRVIDKWEKIGIESVLTSLKELKASPESLDILSSWAHDTSSASDQINRLKSLDWPAAFHDALQHLDQTAQHLGMRGMNAEHIRFSPLLARGLTYYSGITFEAKLPQHGDLGSICAGGRYDHLANMLSSKKAFPGVGASIGLSRLFARFIEHHAPVSPSGDVLICVQDAQHLGASIQLGDTLRDLGVRTEVFLGMSSLKNQLNYANRKGFPLVVLANAQEWENQCVQIKNMSSGQQNLVPISNLPVAVMEHLAKINQHPDGNPNQIQP
jgi:histidyl-tRNA synthetase